MKFNRNLTSGITTIVLAVWLLTLAGFKTRDLLQDHASAKLKSPHVIANWKNLMAGRVPILGVIAANFKIIEFSDYQCPYCGLADPALSHFYNSHPHDVVIYRYDMPLQQIHHYAYAAAIAANCAEQQAVREPYQSLLFQHQREFASLDWTALAKQSGVTDTAAFAQCVNTQAPRDHILKDTNTAQSLGIAGTPSFIINGTLYTQGINEEKLESLYNEMDKKQHGFLHRLFNL